MLVASSHLLVVSPSSPLFVPSPGGQEQFRLLGPDLSSYLLDGLEPATQYRIWLSVLGPAGEGPTREVTARTGEPSLALLPLKLLPVGDPAPASPLSW